VCIGVVFDKVRSYPANLKVLAGEERPSCTGLLYSTCMHMCLPARIHKGDEINTLSERCVHMQAGWLCGRGSFRDARVVLGTCTMCIITWAVPGDKIHRRYIISRTQSLPYDDIPYICSGMTLANCEARRRLSALFWATSFRRK